MRTCAAWRSVWREIMGRARRIHPGFKALARLTSTGPTPGCIGSTPTLKDELELALARKVRVFLIEGAYETDETGTSGPNRPHCPRRELIAVARRVLLCEEEPPRLHL